MTRAWLLPGLLYLVAYVVLTWPAIRHFSTHFFGDDLDTLQNVWNLWWMREAVLSMHVSPYYTDLLYYPDGISLVPQTMSPFNGLVALLVGGVLNEYEVYNLVTVFAFVAGGMTCFALAWDLSKSWGGSLFAGAVFTFSQYHFAQARGHLQLVTLEWIPLFVLWFRRLLLAPSVGRGVLAGLALLLVALSDWYYTFYCVVTGLVLYAHHAWRQRAPLLLLRPGYVRAFVPFLLIVVPPLLAFAMALTALDRRDPLVMSHRSDVFGADLLAFLIPGGAWRFGEWTRAYWQDFPATPVEASCYLGVTLLALSGFALANRKRLGIAIHPWLPLALAFWVFSLGSALHVWGHRLAGIPTPYGLLELLLPQITISGCASRMTVMVLLCLAVVSASALTPFLRTVLRRPWAKALFFAVLAFELWPWEQALSRIERPDWVEALGHLPGGAVHTVTYANTPRELLFQTMHGRPMPLGYPTRCPTSLWQREAMIKHLLERRDYAELLRRYRVRFLVLPNHEVTAEPSCVPVFRGDEETIWVAKDDPIAGDNPLAASLPSYRVESRPADRFALHIHDPRHARRRFLCVFAAARAPAVTRYAGAPLPVALDEEFRLSLLLNNGTYYGNVDAFDAEGRATIFIDGAAVRRRGVTELHFCWYALAADDTPRIAAPGLLGSLRVR